MQPRRRVYFDTSVFIEMGAKKSKHAKNIKVLLDDLKAEKARIYTSILTVQELSVASYRKATAGRDTYGDINRMARIYGITKDVVLTAAKREAELKDITAENEERRDPRKPETDEQRLERICENRRRKWDCFHLATAQLLGCPDLYSTDEHLQKRPAQLGLKGLRVCAPAPPKKRIAGPLTEHAGNIEV